MGLTVEFLVEEFVVWRSVFTKLVRSVISLRGAPIAFKFIHINYVGFIFFSVTKVMYLGFFLASSNRNFIWIAYVLTSLAWDIIVQFSFMLRVKSIFKRFLNISIHKLS